MKKIISMLCVCMLFMASCAPGLADGAAETTPQERLAIESALNLANNPDQEWTYSASADAWTLSVVQAVLYPVIPNEEGLSV